ncbi:unnamed protein product [Ostreobium quekettii]|uniref:Uncharacterized protein n=1 Tax=Ostreobium quekettii TaxID=121088 RepID=A0A8S1ISB8_9CHLO|nr:unnamed protein product [Ostreobium quekettii]
MPRAPMQEAKRGRQPVQSQPLDVILSLQRRMAATLAHVEVLAPPFHRVLNSFRPQSKGALCGQGAPTCRKSVSRIGGARRGSCQGASSSFGFREDEQTGWGAAEEGPVARSRGRRQTAWRRAFLWLPDERHYARGLGARGWPYPSSEAQQRPPAAGYDASQRGHHLVRRKWRPAAAARGPPASFLVLNFLGHRFSGRSWGHSLLGQTHAGGECTGVGGRMFEEFAQLS